MWRFPWWPLVLLFWKPRYQYQLVTGTSRGGGVVTWPQAAIDEAVREAETKMAPLIAQGWQAVSVGVGGRAGMGLRTEGGAGVATAGEAVDVVVLMRK
ncbi:MAG: hypothetical protein HY680_01000 [Chloroflexi bacterium]|nr:hypothetical protein [Chloroflexota bacterium]